MGCRVGENGQLGFAGVYERVRQRTAADDRVVDGVAVVLMASTYGEFNAIRC